MLTADPVLHHWLLSPLTLLLGEPIFLLHLLESVTLPKARQNDFIFLLFYVGEGSQGSRKCSRRPGFWHRSPASYCCPEVKPPGTLSSLVWPSRTANLYLQQRRCVLGTVWRWHRYRTRSLALVWVFFKRVGSKRVRKGNVFTWRWWCGVPPVPPRLHLYTPKEMPPLADGTSLLTQSKPVGRKLKHPHTAPWRQTGHETCLNRFLKLKL